MVLQTTDIGKSFQKRRSMSMSVMNFSLKVSSFHINFDVKRNIKESNMKLKRAVEAEAKINEALQRKESYLKDYPISLLW